MSLGEKLLGVWANLIEMKDPYIDVEERLAGRVF